MATEQTFANHRRLIPSFHFGVFFALAINAGWSLWRVVTQFSWDNLVAAIFGVALVRMFFYVRSFATRNQDRIIRLEMRLRLERLLPADLKTRIPEFTVAQLVGLRYAGDAELPGLARKVLAENHARPEPIKALVTDWQPDLQRV